MIERVVLATKNVDKVPEMRAVLATVWPRLEVVSDVEFPDVTETGRSLDENALLKARSAARATGIAAIGDDTGLEVDALGGAPGVRSARYAGEAASYEDNRRALLEAMDGVAGRSARFRTAVALVTPDGQEMVVSGVLEGRITEEERGSGGFGYDSVFEVDGSTLAEMGELEKNRISHRARGIAALAELLSSL